MAVTVSYFYDWLIKHTPRLFEMDDNIAGDSSTLSKGIFRFRLLNLTRIKPNAFKYLSSISLRIAVPSALEQLPSCSKIFKNLGTEINQ